MRAFFKKYLVTILGKLYKILEYSYQKSEYDKYRMKYDIHPTFCFNGKGILFYGDGIIKIDKNTYIGRYSAIQASSNSMVFIGKNCKIGPFFNIWTQSSNVDHDYNFDESIVPKIGNIIIEDAVWIGANVIISPGITIGSNSIIGANSVVTKDVAPFSIVGGVPAKLLRFKKIDPSIIS